MADGNGELLAAFDSLAKSVNQVQISNSIARAQQHVDAIRQDQTMNEFEKIRAQQALAQSMGTEVLARGGDAAHAEQARLSLAPQIPDAAMRQMEATGKDTLAGAQEAIHQRTIKEEIDKEKRESALKIAQLQVATGMKQQMAQGKQLVEYGKALDPNGPRAGNFGASGKVVQAAQRIEGLFQQFPDYNVPKAQTTELATAVAAMVSGGSPQSQHQIDAITPQSLKGNAAGIASWLTNNPNGQEQQSFMKMMHETAVREKAVAIDQIRNVQDARDTEFAGLLTSDNPAVVARATAIKSKFNSLYPRANEAGASAQSPSGYPVGQGLNKYITIKP